MGATNTRHDVHRIQLSRSKGWRKPDNTVDVLLELANGVAS